MKTMDTKHIVNKTKRKNNATTLLLLPTLYHIDINKRLHVTKYNYKLFVNNYFINAFIGDLSISQQNELKKHSIKILLLYRIGKDYDFIGFEDKIIQHPYYKYDYVRKSKDEIVYVFEIPSDIYGKTWNLFINNKFYKFTDEYKKEINLFWNLPEKYNLFNRSIFGCAFLKEQDNINKIDLKVSVDNDFIH